MSSCMTLRHRRRGFTITEILVVVAVLATLLSLLLPAIGSVRRSARAAACMSNMRQIGSAHIMYMNVNREAFVTAGLPHGGVGDPKSSWLTKLPQAYLDGTLGLRSPVDHSPYWSSEEGGSHDGLTLADALHWMRNTPGAPLPANLISRWSSYALNVMLTDLYSYPDPSNPGREMRFTRLNAVPRPANTVHFVMLTEGFRHPESDPAYARSDHVHTDGWMNLPAPLFEQAPRFAVRQIEIGAHGGPTAGWTSLSNYLFLDGHVETLEFREVYDSPERNKLFPLATP